MSYYVLGQYCFGIYGLTYPVPSKSKVHTLYLDDIGHSFHLHFLSPGFFSLFQYFQRHDFHRQDEMTYSTV